MLGELAVGNYHYLCNKQPFAHKAPEVNEFLMQMEMSTFGKGLITCTRTLNGTEDDLWALMCPLTRPKVLERASCDSPWGPLYNTMVAVRDTWREIAWTLNMQGVQGPNGLLARIERQEYLPPAMFDDMWANYDLELWEESKPRAEVGRHRALARHFGLYDPTDRTRPTCTRRLLREDLERARDLSAQARQRSAAEAKVKAQKADPVIVTPSQTAAQSGRAYVAEAGLAPKEKLKTRKNNDVEPFLAPTESSDENKYDDMPEFLPSGYKLGKKVLKVGALPNFTSVSFD